MAVEAMANPLEKLKKIRSWDEIRTRGGQAFSAYREQKLGGREVPSDEEFFSLIDATQFGTAPIIAESLWQKFYKNSEESFFLSFKNRQDSAEAFSITFGLGAAEKFTAAAAEIVKGRIDLLGFKNLYVGAEIDWHREPVSARRSPLKHWKEFDALEAGETGNKKIIWELNRHQHFFTLGVAYMLTGDERFAVSFAGQLDSWMEQNPPGIGVNWSSSLEVSLRAMSWIWAFNFFRDSEHFTPDLLKKALKYLYLHARHIEQYLSKYYSPNTHLTGEGLGLYYLGTQLPFFDRAKRWRKLGEDILFSEITKQVLPDGVYFEQSTWYQRYTADIYTHFVILRSLNRDSGFDLRSAELEERLQKAFDHLMHLTMPDGKTPLIGDDDGGRMLPLTTAEPDDFRGSLSVSSIIFDRADHKFVSGRSSEEIFWLLGPDGIDHFKARDSSEPGITSDGFVDGGYFVMRDGWNDTDNVMVVDCGPVGSLAGGHGHADALSIELAMRGKTLLVDSGTYTYHESPELRDYFRSGTAHNTLVIDGVSSSMPGDTFGWKTQAQTHLKTWFREDRFDFFEGSHNGYERLADSATHSRSILFLKNDYWIMRDFVETLGEHEYSLNFHFPDNLKPAIGDGGAWVGDKNHRLFTFGDNGAWEQKESWISTNHGNRVNAPFMRFVSKGSGTQEFFTMILPVDQGTLPPEVNEVPTLSGRAFVIRYQDYNDFFVFNDEPDRSIETGIFDTNFRYSWARMRVGEILPDEFVLIDGNSLMFDGNAAFVEPDVPYAAVRRLGNELYIKTDSGIRNVSLGFVERRKRNRREPVSDRRRPVSK